MSVCQYNAIIMEEHCKSLALQYDLFINNTIKLLDTAVERGKSIFLLVNRLHKNKINCFSIRIFASMCETPLYLEHVFNMITLFVFVLWQMDFPTLTNKHLCRGDSLVMIMLEVVFIS